MNKWIIRALAFVLFAPTVYLLHVVSGGYPLLTLIIVMGVLTSLRLFEKHRLPEEQTVVSWVQKTLKEVLNSK